MKNKASSFALSLSGDGQAELYLYLPGFDGTGRSHTLAHVKGTVQVDGDQLTLSAQSGADPAAVFAPARW